MGIRQWRGWGLCAITLCLVAGCQGPERDAEKVSRSQQPIAPLVYTEDPEAKQSAVRERRLLQELIQTSGERSRWGGLKEHTDELERAPLTSSEKLGRAIFDALVDRNAFLWEEVFARVSEFDRVFPVKTSIADRRIREALTKSERVWQSFDIREDSSVRVGGLANLLEFESLELGVSRNPRGEIVGVPITPAEHRNNVLKVSLKSTQTVFEFYINRIMRFEKDGEPVYRVAGPVEIDPRFSTFLEAGLHYKSRTMQSGDYPFPLKVGNFWYYERRVVERNAPDAALSAREFLLEVESVSRYEFYRIVKLRHSYDDARLTKFETKWIVTPRLIVRCDKKCEQAPSELNKVLDVIGGSVPLFRFPLTRGSSWSRLGESDGANSIFRVADDWVSLELPAGRFSRVTPIRQTTILKKSPIRPQMESKTRYFANGIGVIKRQIETPEASIEERLTDYRISP